MKKNKNIASSKRKNRFKKDLPLFLIALPGLIYFLINNYIPMAGIFIAFKKIDYVKGIFGSDWSGLDNFKFLFQTKDAWIMIRNTVSYNVTFIILGTICAVFIAILMSEVSKYFVAKIFQAGLILPNLVSMVVIAYLVYAFLNSETGLVNMSILPFLGKEDISWYSQAKYWPFILVIVQMWKTAGVFFYCIHSKYCGY